MAYKMKNNDPCGSNELHAASIIAKKTERLFEEFPDFKYNYNC